MGNMRLSLVGESCVVKFGFLFAEFMTCGLHFGSCSMQ